MESPPKILTGLELRCHVQPYDWRPLGYNDSSQSHKLAQHSET